MPVERPSTSASTRRCRWWPEAKLASGGPTRVDPRGCGAGPNRGQAAASPGRLGGPRQRGRRPGRSCGVRRVGGRGAGGGGAWGGPGGGGGSPRGGGPAAAAVGPQRPGAGGRGVVRPWGGGVGGGGGGRGGGRWLGRLAGTSRGGGGVGAPGVRAAFGPAPRGRGGPLDAGCWVVGGCGGRKGGTPGGGGMGGGGRWCGACRRSPGVRGRCVWGGTSGQSGVRAGCPAAPVMPPAAEASVGSGAGFVPWGGGPLDRPPRSGPSVGTRTPRATGSSSWWPWRVRGGGVGAGATGGRGAGGPGRAAHGGAAAAGVPGLRRRLRLRAGARAVRQPRLGRHPGGGAEVHPLVPGAPRRPHGHDPGRLRAGQRRQLPGLPAGARAHRAVARRGPPPVRRRLRAGAVARGDPDQPDPQVGAHARGGGPGALAAAERADPLARAPPGAPHRALRHALLHHVGHHERPAGARIGFWPVLLRGCRWVGRALPGSPAVVGDPAERR